MKRHWNPLPVAPGHAADAARRSMHAWVVESPGPLREHPLRLVELPRPVARAGEIVVRVRACAICRTDLHVVEGELALRQPRVVPGHQVVGVVEELGKGVTEPRVGTRVGVAWLHGTCGVCRFCASGRENLCDSAEFTGWTTNGGFAELVRARAEFVYPLGVELADEQAAPLLCAGIIGQRALRLAGYAEGKAPGPLGIWGFGAAGHVVIQLARAFGSEVHVLTRDRERHQALAKELGAASVGDTFAPPPRPLAAGIVFAPAGEVVPHALRALDKGGVLVLGGIHMTDVPSLPYELLYGERVVRSVANNTRQDGRELLDLAQRVPVRTRVRTFGFAEVPEALAALKDDAIRGAGVIVLP